MPLSLRTGHQKRLIGQVGPRLAKTSPWLAVVRISPRFDEFLLRILIAGAVTSTQPCLLDIALASELRKADPISVNDAMAAGTTISADNRVQSNFRITNFHSKLNL